MANKRDRDAIAEARDEVTEATPPNQPPNTLAAIFSNANFT